jgi:hypothetical protein
MTDQQHPITPPPEPPSLKEQALTTLKFLSTVMTADQHDLIQSALERLSDDER